MELRTTYIEHGHPNNDTEISPSVAIEDVEPSFQELIRCADSTVTTVGEIVWIFEISTEIVNKQVHVIATGERIGRLHSCQFRLRAVNSLTTDGW